MKSRFKQVNRTMLNVRSNLIGVVERAIAAVLHSITDWQAHHLPVTTEQLLRRFEKGELEREDLLCGVQLRQETKASGWKGSRRPVKVEEAELANYERALVLLEQGKPPFSHFLLPVVLLVGVGGILGGGIAEGVRMLFIH